MLSYSTNFLCLFTHPGGLAVGVASVLSIGTELLLNSQELVVLGQTLGTARSTSLDLTRAEPDSQVSNVVVLGFTTAVGGHHAPTVLLGKLNGLNGLGDGTDLVHLEQQGVGGAVYTNWEEEGDIVGTTSPLYFDLATSLPLLSRLLDLLGVGDSQVIAHYLNVLGHAAGELDPAVPVILVEWVLDGDDGEVLRQILVEVAQLLAADLLASIAVLVLFKFRLKIRMVMVIKPAYSPYKL